jgi:predicted nucleotidyltransferase
MNEHKLDREYILAELRQLKPELNKLYGVSRLGLFGSFARDEAKAESDIDVVVEMDEPDLFTMVHIKETLEEDFQRPVDVIHYRPLMNRFLKSRIERDAIYV